MPHEMLNAVQRSRLVALHQGSSGSQSCETVGSTTISALSSSMMLSTANSDADASREDSAAAVRRDPPSATRLAARRGAQAGLESGELARISSIGSDPA